MKTCVSHTTLLLFAFWYPIESADSVLVGGRHCWVLGIEHCMTRAGQRKMPTFCLKGELLNRINIANITCFGSQPHVKRGLHNHT